MSSQTHARAKDDSQVMTAALLRAADLLRVKQSTLARVTGDDAATISRFRKGTRQLRAGTKSWEAALLFIRLFRALDALMGSDDEAAHSWLTTHNEHLNGVPLELICTSAGLVHVVDYLDAFRAKV